MNKLVITYQTYNMDIKHIFFDLDHTLWDFDRNSDLAFEAIFKNFDIQINLGDFLRVYKPINREYWNKYEKNLVSKIELRRGRFAEAFSCFDITYSVSELDKLAEAYLDTLPKNNYLIKGAKDILESLTDLYDLHIITNGFDQVQKRKLINSGIANCFKTVTTSDSIGVKKPDALIFEYALKTAGAQPTNSLMIGDSYEADVLGAKATGMEAIFFNYHQDELPCDVLIITELKQLKNHLE